MQRGRAYRRWQQQRRKRRVINRLRNECQLDDKWITPQTVGYLTNTRTPCSCWMCGHKRQLLGPTRQERTETIEAHQ